MPLRCRPMIRRAGVLVTLACLLAMGSLRNANAQVVNPADKGAQAADQGEGRVRTWDMPPITVVGEQPQYKEDERIGDYQQPRWTADRLFGETRTYVIPKGKVEFEYWFIPETPREGTTDTATQYEFEFGLPGRFQLDFYLVGHKDGLDGSFAITENKAEVRWAFADWGKIWGNPTIYLEWKTEHEAPDHLEVKLLLAGSVAPGWHWGSNFVWEHELGANQENSNEWTFGLSRTVRDGRFDLGLETQLALVNELDSHGNRGDFEKQFSIGPSAQFRPLPQIHINVASLFGTTDASNRSKVFVVFGYEF